VTRRRSFVFLVCALALLLACNGSSRPVHDDLGAKIACKDYVKARLKAPGTAKFGDALVMPWKGDGCYQVSGYVDSQNSFGALLRTKYRCYVCSSGKQDVYFLRSLSMD